MPVYDRIGLDYADLRRPDPRIAAAIRDALGPARTVLNVGAGAGSYEPTDRILTAVEPSQAMIDQRRQPAAAIVRAEAEDLPFPDAHFDAAMAVLTVHHWHDKARGMAELRRVTRGPIAIMTYVPAFRGFWLTDYFPDFITLDEAQMLPMADYRNWLGPVEVRPLLVPHDCTDGFLCAYWRRPAAYLDPRVRGAMSSFWRIGDVDDGLRRLEGDLASGAWTDRHGDLLALEACDLGYRLVVTG